MLLNIIGQFSIILCILYSCNKLANIKLSIKKYFGIAIISFSVAIVTNTIINYNIFLGIIFILSFCSIYIFFIKKCNFTLSITILLISIGLGILSLIIINAVICFLLILLYGSANRIPYHIIQCVILLPFHQLFIFFIFKLKRLHKGIILLLQKQQTQNSLFLALMLILCLTYSAIYQTNFSMSIQTFFYLLLLLLSFILIFYWRYRITQTYREKLILANQKSLENELQNKSQEIAHLKADNERLARIVHKDNKLIPAMEQAVMDYLTNSHNLSPLEQKEIAHSLGARLHSMAVERHGFLSSSSNTSTSWTKSGLHTVDGMLSFMETRCKNENITYKVQIEENITELIRSAISEENLVHLLGDLIDNAIIASRYISTDRTLGVYLGSLQKHFLLEITDNGIPFTPETYQHFGNEQHTTHSQEGGTGIGLMDVFAIKRKYKASLQIFEYLPGTHTYSKKITFVFDRKNHFLIQTFRYHELLSTLTRGDIYVTTNEIE